MKKKQYQKYKRQDNTVYHMLQHVDIWEFTMFFSLANINHKLLFSL